MPIEKLLTRTLALLAFIFLVASLVYYPPSYAIPPAVFLLAFIAADIILPSRQKAAEKPWERAVSKTIIGLLIFIVLASATCVLILWKLGPFGKFSMTN